MAKRDDNVGRMMACLSKIDSNRKFADLLMKSAAFHALIKSERDIGIRAKMIQVVDECDKSMKFWKNRPDFDITVVARMRSARA